MWIELRASKRITVQNKPKWTIEEQNKTRNRENLKQNKAKASSYCSQREPNVLQL